MTGIFWIGGNPPPPLAIVLCPAWQEQLQRDMLRLRQGGVETVVSLLEEDEARWLGLAEEAHFATQAGLRFLSFPIHDVSVPAYTDAFRNFVTGLAGRLRAGEKIGVHCRGSIGRSTITAACALIHLGWKPQAALNAIEAARGCPVPNTDEQLRWILRYEAEP